MVSQEVRKYLALAGCTLLVMPVCVHLTFGNLLSYLLSYYNDKAPAIVEWINPLWTTTAFMMTHSLGILLSSFLDNYLCPRTAMIFGVVLISGSVLLTYYTVVQPLGFILMFGAVQGLGGGFVTALVVKILTEVMPEDTELAFTVAWIGPGFYAMIQMLMAFYLINPTNHPPEVAVHHVRHFAKPAILDSVPCYFLKIGLMTLLVELIGFVLIQFESDQHAGQTQYYPEVNMEIEIEGNAQYQPASHTAQTRGYSNHGAQGQGDDLQEETALTSELWASGDETTPGTHSSSLPAAVAIPAPQPATDPSKDSEMPYNETTGLVQAGTSTDGATFTKPQAQSSPDLVEATGDLSPQQTLERAQFWKLWLMTAMMGHAFFIHINLYKQHGLTQIHRDKLLTTCGVIGLALMITTRPLSSVVASKIGLKVLLLLLCAISNILMTLLPISLSHSPVLYALCVIVQFCTILSLFLLINMLPLILFGPSFYPMNLGLLNTALIFVYAVDSGLIPILIRDAGWNIVYITGTFTSTIGFFLCLTIPFKDLHFQ